MCTALVMSSCSSRPDNEAGAKRADASASTDAATCASETSSGPATSLALVGVAAPGAALPLDCALVGGNNCWKSTVAPALACLPPAAEKGSLSADGKTCTYPCGTLVVAFSTTLADSPSSFSVMAGSTECVHYYEDSSSEWTLTTSAGSVTLSYYTVENSTAIRLTCPDGSEFYGDEESLASCHQEVPGYDVVRQDISGADGGSEFTLTLYGTGRATDPVVFSCDWPM